MLRVCRPVSSSAATTCACCAPRWTGRGPGTAGPRSWPARPGSARPASSAGSEGSSPGTGGAGIGKTSLVRRFVAELPGDVRVLVGVCDDLLAPRALGPLQEAVAGPGGPPERALGGGPGAVSQAAVAQLRAPRPTVLVLDDVQWADDATL